MRRKICCDDEYEMLEDIARLSGFFEEGVAATLTDETLFDLRDDLLYISDMYNDGDCDFEDMLHLPCFEHIINAIPSTYIIGF